MGRKNTGLSNNPTNQDEVTPNTELEQPRAGEDSDSDLEENDHLGGYMPLSQNPNDGEPLYGLSNESEDEEMNLQESDTACASGDSENPVPEIKASSTTLVEEDFDALPQVWSKPAPKEVDIEMTDKKIDLVKQVMLNIQLPSEAIPTWARNIPEAEWKDHLLQRLNKSDK